MRIVPALPTSAPPAPTARLAARLRASHFLRDVPLDVVEQLATRATVRELVAGATLWREGDLAIGFHVICAGLITIRRTLASGSEVIVAIFGPHENVGDTAALEAGRYPADAVISSDRATVIRIDAQHVLELAAATPALSLALQHALCRHNAALRTKVEILSAGTVKARLANLFLHLAARFGDEPGDGTIMVPVVLSRATLSSLVSARAETVIRALRPWEASGVLITQPTGFVLGDPARLRAVAADG